MPAKNSVKEYLKNSYYHLYNRGVEKRNIFLDLQDYNVFLSYLKEYLLPKDEKTLFTRLSAPDCSAREKDKIIKALNLNNFYGEISHNAYSLIPNHFHFSVKQKDSNAIDLFMNSLCTRYSMYFNHKYQRVGVLYQDVYKAVCVTSDEQLLYLSAYIHRQALSLQGSLQGDALEPRQPSSFSDYTGLTKNPWINTQEILTFFSKTNPRLSYESFVKQENEFVIIQKLILEE